MSNHLFMQKNGSLFAYTTFPCIVIQKVYTSYIEISLNFRRDGIFGREPKKNIDRK